ncbi:MAG: S-layer homology domain-containing protein [Peptoniphilus sp.]|uniref:S-layer homology domain-containing protein n=1 Tax=Peptoniphilus sp. TaxID=1971214 RepID=UPI0025EB7CAF|nr:S-layer homology domain-containing protein [Peptoniphilus sp.]MCI5643512.1 S-layer homology domain-containing protein [Peptoniphilus sp.]MDD7352105.1 S-layer homology domain-containing protein [Peptoniphilaceae bacterium]MDY3903476.1 S-layer homology domain-containing protein [Peptoniphilus sp.]
MKPYSKKYLTLALAGVLVSSMPVSAFAQTETTTGAKADTPTTSETTTSDKAQPESPAARETEADKSNLSSLNYTLNRGERFYASDINLPDGARIVDNETFKFDSKGDYERTVKVQFNDGSTKNVTIYFKVKDRYDDRYYNITLTNVKYDGTYLKGETSAYARIYVENTGYRDYRNGKYLGEADRDGYFSLRLDLKEGESVNVHAEKDGYNSRSVEVKNDNNKNIKGSKVDASDLRITGRTLTGYVKNHPFENVRVYMDGKLLGSFRTDKDSYFTVTLSESVYDKELEDLKFYTDSKTVENKKFKITEALEGQKLVKGTANAKDEITVYDASNRKLGSITVNNSGVFTVFLDRELIYGETIKIEAKNEAGDITKIEYKVTKNAVEEVKAIAYIKGYPDGTFKPQANVTRAEAAQMFATLLNGGADFGTSSATKFSDASDNWFSKAINYVVAKGLISGYPDGTFKPNESITRAEFAQMISGYVKNEKKGSSDFQDVKDHWAKSAIEKLYGNKNVTGYPDGTFKPNAKITRAEAVTILNSVFNRNTTKNSLNNVNTSSLNKFSDVSEGFWAYYNILDAANTHNRERLNSTSEVDMWK